MSDTPSKQPSPPPVQTLPVQTLPVFPAHQFRVVQGVNEGDGLTDASDLVLEDSYMLDNGLAGHLAASPPDDSGALCIMAGSELGTPGAPIFLDCLLTFMPPHGDTLEALVLVETSPERDRIAEVYLYPLTPFTPGVPYALVTIDIEGARARMAEAACVSFTRGTCITMASGQQMPIEQLTPGDKILTRDSGPQPIRWIGQQTVRATGAFAPITIAAGVLNNDAKLTVSPSHRLFIYQRHDRLGVGQNEVLVRAGHLVNGDTVTQTEGGFVDYFQLLFDKHEIIYAEGIPAESLFVDDTNRPALPDGMTSHEIKPYARELSADEMSREDVVGMIKGATKR